MTTDIAEIVKQRLSPLTLGSSCARAISHLDFLTSWNMSENGRKGRFMSEKIHDILTWDQLVNIFSMGEQRVHSSVLTAPFSVFHDLHYMIGFGFVYMWTKRSLNHLRDILWKTEGRLLWCECWACFDRQSNNKCEWLGLEDVNTWICPEGCLGGSRIIHVCRSLCVSGWTHH